MEQVYHVYAGDKGFWGNSGTYVSQFKDAKPFTREEALKFCKTRFNKHLGDLSYVPVLAMDMREVLA